MIQIAMRDGSNFFEWTHRRTDGNEFPATVLLSQIEISGQVLLQATVRDISIRKSAEKQLQQKSLELEILTEELRKFSSLLSQADEMSRRQLARILHEQIGQNLAVLNMKFDEITEGIVTGETKIKEIISSLMPLLENTISSTRELTSELYPTILDDLGFLPAIIWYKDLVFDPLKIAVLMDIDKSVEDLSSDYKLSLFRIIQEAFQNISKHARATEVDVKLSMYGRSMKLYIKDNGVGFNLKEMKAKKDKGIGLMLLKERSISLGGRLTIESALGKGTALNVGLPTNKQ
jgi:signal transduction histidine kinase